MRPVILCDHPNLTTQWLAKLMGALARTAAVPDTPGVTTVAQVLPFIDLMDLCQPAEGS